MFSHHNHSLRSLRLGLALFFTLFVAVTSWAKTEPISYIDENGDEKFLEPGSYTLLDTLIGGEYGQPDSNNVVHIPGGWYVLQHDFSIDSPVDFANDAQLVIADGVTLFVTNDDFSNKFTGSGNLTIYGQKDGSGVLNIDVLNVSKTLTVNNIHLNSNTSIKSTDSYFVFNGGSLNASYVGENNKLRWNKGTDFVYVSTFEPSCSSSTAIDENTPFVDEEGKLYKGDYLTANGKLNGKMLKPAFVIDVDYQDGLNKDTFVARFDEENNAFFVKEPPSEPTLDGAKFLGWSTTATGEINEFDWKEPVKQNTKVYARWELKPIKYVDENGKPQSITQYIELSNMIKKSDGGTMFVPGGWYVLNGKIEESFDIVFNEDSHIVLDDKADIKLGSINAYGDISFYAGVALNNEDDSVVGSGVLNLKNIVILKDAAFNGGQLKLSNRIYAYSSKSSIAINGGIIEAAELVYANLSLGWLNVGGLITVNTYTKRNENSELSIADGKTFTDKEKNVYSGTLTEKQIAAIQSVSLTPCYTVTFALPDGSVLSTEVASFDENGNAWVDVSKQSQTHSGMKILGWYTKPDGGTEVIGTHYITSNTTLYARLGIEYVDKNNETQLATSFTVLNDVLDKLNDPDDTEYGLDKNGEFNLPGGTYVVLPDKNAVEFANPINFNGKVLLIVADGAEMSVLDKKKVTVNGNLDIYGQKEGSGKLNVHDVQAYVVSINNVHLTSDGKIQTYDVYVAGGSLNINTLSGSKMTLGWSDFNNSIEVQEYEKPSSSSSIYIADDRAFVDENGEVYSKVVYFDYDDNEKPFSPLNGKKLTPSYAVAFDLRDGTPAKIEAAPFDEKLNGFVVEQPSEKPVRFDGAEFLGWAYGDELIDWSKPFVITKNATIYAKWKQKPIKYVDAKGETQIIEDYIMLSNGMTIPYDDDEEIYSLPGGWYVVPNSNPEGVDLSLEEGIFFNGDAHLILEDGAEMNLPHGNTPYQIFDDLEAQGAVQAGNDYDYEYDLSIYAGSFAVEDESPIAGSGVLTAEVVVGNNVTFNGGHVNATMVIYNNKVAINGGVTEITAFHGFDWDAKGIELDWRSFDDRITVEQYAFYINTGKLTIADGKYFKDEDGNVYNGTIEFHQDSGSTDLITVLDGKTLIPMLSLGDENIVVADIPVQTYTGYSICPDVVVKDGNKTLEVKTDYTVECFENVDKSSTAPYVEITGMGIYGGVIKKKFAIIDKGTNLAAIKFFWDEDGHSIASIDGNYSEDETLNIVDEITADKIILNRSFKQSGFATIMLPFDYDASNLQGVKSIIEFNGVLQSNGKTDVGMQYVWCNKAVQDSLKDAAIAKCNENGGSDCENTAKYERCNEPDYYANAGKIAAYTPYMVQMDADAITFLAGATLLPTPATTETRGQADGDWVFRGTLQKHTWTEDETKGGLIRAFAAKVQDGAKQIGQFVKLGAGAYSPALRAYMIKEPKAPKNAPLANGAKYSPAMMASTENDLPETMDVVIISRSTTGGNEQTTVIGTLNPRTGEFRLNNVGKRTFDLKGRSVSKPRAKGIYLKK